MTKNKKKGLLWLLGPFALLFATLSVYAVSTFALQQLGIKAGTAGSIDPISVNSLSGNSQVSDQNISGTVGKLVRLVLGLIGVIAVVGMTIGIPLGIYYLTRHDQKINILELQKNTVYSNLSPEQIYYIQDYSWSAFFGVFIWSLANKMWLWSFLALVPFVNIYTSFKLAAQGRAFAWEKGGWKNFDQFKKRQKIVSGIIWTIIGLCVFINII